MKINMVIPSRGRPAGMLSALTVMDALSTGENEVVYPIVVADDDTINLPYLDAWKDLFPKNAIPMIGSGEKTVAERMNEAYDLYPADWYSYMTDDAFPLMQHWDKVFQAAKDYPAFCWCYANDPGNATYIVISDKWKKAIGALTTHFPFWFSDTWLMEVHLLAFAKPIPIVQQLGVGGKRGKTRDMHDLGFWFEYYTYTRPERIAQAELLAKAYGFTVNVRKERGHFLEQMADSDRKQRMMVEKYEATFSVGGERIPQYVNAKRKAEERMRRAA